MGRYRTVDPSQDGLPGRAGWRGLPAAPPISGQTSIATISRVTRRLVVTTHEFLTTAGRILHKDSGERLCFICSALLHMGTVLRLPAPHSHSVLFIYYQNTYALVKESKDEMIGLLELQAA